MHRMTRALGNTDIHAPFGGDVFAFKGDSAILEQRGAERYLRMSSESRGAALFRVTKVIGGRYREDFVGVQVDPGQPEGPGIGEEHVLPVSYLIWNGQWRYKGYSVMVRERPGLERGVVWRQSCIFCHNTVPGLMSYLDELHGPGLAPYQGSASNELPVERAFRYRINDERALEQALAGELSLLRAGQIASGSGAKRALALTAAAVRERFDERHLVELGVGCEMCHGGALEHVRDPHGVRPTFAVKSEFMEVTTAGGSVPTPAQDVNRTCAKCHTVLFSRYPYTWEGRTRRDRPGGSNINSGEARDFLLGGCSAQMSCTSCHDPHGNDSRERLEALAGPAGNALCSGCHERYRDPESLRTHTHHAPASPGSACLNCHMPRKNMGLAYELTRYHRIGSPTDPERVLGDRPLECALCHQNRSVDQIVSTMERWWHKTYDRRALRRLYGQNLRVNALEATLLAGRPHERAVAANLAAQGGREELVPAMVLALEDEYPLVRYFVHHAIERIEGPFPLDPSAPKAVIGAAKEAWLNARESP
jgi:predicted CXXCH cytochrome family protein